MTSVGVSSGETGDARCEEGCGSGERLGGRAVRNEGLGDSDSSGPVIAGGEVVEGRKEVRVRGQAVQALVVGL